MTVHFQGVSEYQSKYKSRAAHRMSQAGLRSDHSKITREPQFLTKKKVPCHTAHVCGSFRLDGKEGDHRVRSPADIERTPLCSRDPTPQDGTSAPSPQPKASAAKRSSGTNQPTNARAGLRPDRQRNDVSSEYQRQFLWKTPVAESPVLEAYDMFYSSSRLLPPFRSNPVVMETEYRRSFTGSPPPRPPGLRRNAQHSATPEKKLSKRKKKKEQNHSKSHPEGEVVQPPSPHAQEKPSCKVKRKAKTEYRSSFLSPHQYAYRDGAWVKIKSAKEEECQTSHCWCHEMQDLREKAEIFKKRAWGTHFSRQHTNQILSEHNWMWEPSRSVSSCSSVSGCGIEDLEREGSVRRSSVPVETSRGGSTGQSRLPEPPTLPVHRTSAWDEEPESRHSVASEAEHQDITGEDTVGKPKSGSEQASEDGDMLRRNGRSQVSEVGSSSSSSSTSASEESRDINVAGRMPTPKLKGMRTVQRTHHDRTTPAAGGALLVAPPKIKNAWRGRSEAPLRKHLSPHRLRKVVSPQQPNCKVEDGGLVRLSPAAGLTTMDPLPMRDDDDDGEVHEEEDHSAIQRQAKPSHKKHTKAAICPANRIQGTLRDPEFQHNGELGIFRPELVAFPETDPGASDNEDRMSQLSYRSANSCSVASQVLGRAQKRKEDFWGK